MYVFVLEYMYRSTYSERVLDLISGRFTDEYPPPDPYASSLRPSPEIRKEERGSSRPEQDSHHSYPPRHMVISH